MRSHNSTSPRTRSQRGVSLIEIMIGAALGMVCVIIIFQVLTLWESRTRTTSAGSDAQISGTLAVYALERDIKMAGMGFGTATSAVAGCTVAGFHSTLGTFTFPMAPVVINRGASGAPDSIQVLYGNSPYHVDDQPFDASTVNSKTTRSSAGFQLGDLMVIASTVSTDCALVEVTGYAPSDSKIIQHDTTDYISFYTNAAKTPAYNAAGGPTATFTVGRLFSLGPAPSSNLWSINSSNVLNWFNTLSSTAAQASEVSEGIINLKAQYGIDGFDGCPEDNRVVDSGCGSGDYGEWTSTLPSPMDWSKLRAIRFSLLARSRQYDPVAVTTTYPRPSWLAGEGDASVVAAEGFAVDEAGGAAGTWQHYRYRVYESVVPLRNVIWGTSP